MRCLCISVSVPLKMYADMGKPILRDISEGDLTYGERIELGRIVRDENMGDYQRIKEVCQCLYDVEVTPEQAVHLTDHVAKVLTDIIDWMKKEQQEFYIPPTPEEERARIQDLTKACGDMGDVVSLAESFQCSFEEVYNKPYLEIFTIHKVHAERTRYERRLNKVYQERKK